MKNNSKRHPHGRKRLFDTQIADETGYCLSSIASCLRVAGRYADAGQFDDAYKNVSLQVTQFPNEPVLYMRQLDWVMRCSKPLVPDTQVQIAATLSRLQQISPNTYKFNLDERQFKSLSTLNRKYTQLGWHDLRKQLLDVAVRFFPGNTAFENYRADADSGVSTPLVPAAKTLPTKPAQTIVPDGSTEYIRHVLSEVSHAVVTGSVTDPLLRRCERKGKQMVGLDLALVLLAKHTAEFPNEPVFAVYRAAFSINHPRMQTKNKVEQIRLATAAFETATHDKMYNYRIGSDAELKLVADMATYCRTTREHFMGIRLIDAATPYFSKDKSVLPKLREHLDMLRRPVRSNRLTAAQIPSALAR